MQIWLMTKKFWLQEAVLVLVIRVLYEMYIYINKVTVRVFVADNFPYILPYFVTDIPSVYE